MRLDSESCFGAVRGRDRRFDGRFFVAVTSTGIYCRPICPVRAPKRENMRFFVSAAAAERQGFRPCLRCRPERAPGLAPIDSKSRLAAAAAASIEQHSLTSAGVGALAASLGVTDRHLRRVMEAEYGVTPIELAQTGRLLLAKRLLRDTTLSQTQIAFASGFGSVRRFNALFKARYGLSPRAVRGATRECNPATATGDATTAGDGDTNPSLTCQLDFRPPLAWESLLGYLRLRAIPGVEAVADGCYRRTAAIDGHAGWISVSLHPSGHALEVRIAESLTPVIGAVLYRLKHLFDLGAAPDAVSAHLVQDALLAPVVRRLPGLRVPGAFDGFELAVRAVLGQQVSVKSATTFAGRWAQVFGAPIATPYADLCRLTPSASRMADAASVTKAQIAALGIVGSRAKTLIALAEAVADQRIQLSYAADVDAQIESLMQVPGVGPWTAQYIAMRALHWPDAFPSRDLVLLKAARTTHRELVARAQAWRPWRAYAAHYLWQSILGASL